MANAKRRRGGSNRQRRVARDESGLRAEGTIRIPPDPEGILEAIARIGYSLEEALGDLVDNSVDAKARVVLIRFFRTDDRLISIAVVDDGEGMSESRMDWAMGFGVKTGKGPSQLGKYGLGLKSASFSQCRAMTVISKDRKTKKVAARRWTAENISRDWLCERLNRSAARVYLGQDWGVLSTSRSGTCVQWEDLSAFNIPADRADGVLENMFKSITRQLGLNFHRFIASGRLKIFLDTYNTSTRLTGPPRDIPALDPFSYPRTGHRSYPRAFKMESPGFARLELEAHIWPPKSRHSGYLLGGGKVSQRQGFYFYRNDRLIQAGGWNGWRDDAEPHLSLARVAVEIPTSLDDTFRLNVQKSTVTLPVGFLDQLAAASSGRVTFHEYVQAAQETYRSSKMGRARGPAVPASGVPSSLRKRLERQVRSGNGQAITRIGFEWAVLPPGLFFSIDREDDVITLNSRYRSAVLMGRRGSAGDAPLVKALLVLLLTDEIDRQRDSAASRDWLTMAQRMLVAAAKAQAKRVNSPR